jgi:hypothetical protein
MATNNILEAAPDPPSTAPAHTTPRRHGVLRAAAAGLGRGGQQLQAGENMQASSTGLPKMRELAQCFDCKSLSET